MYIYFDRNKVLREIINDEAIVQGLNRNKIYIYYELQGDNVLTFNSGKFRLSDNTEIDILSGDVTTISDLSSDAAFIPYNKDRDLKFFKYGKGYPFTVITVNSSVYSESGPVLGTVTVTVSGYSAETLERFIFMVEETNGIETAEPIDISLYEYLLNLFANKNVFAVTAIPQDVSIYNVDDVLINLTDKKLYRITGSPKAANLWLDLSDLATDTDLQNHINDKYNPHEVTKAQIGLGNVINTGDSDTPVENGTDKFTTGGAYDLQNDLLDRINNETDRAMDVESDLDEKIDDEISDRKLDAGHSIDMTIDSNFDLVVKLLNANEKVISQDDVDLPLESIVVSATYYDTYTYEGVTYNKVIVIVLATTSVPTIVPVGDLVSGLVSTDELATTLGNYYTKTQVDALLSGKADSDSVYTKQEVDDIVDDIYTKTEVDDKLEDKQDTLVSGTNIKTLNGTSLLGSGNYTFDNALNESSTNAVQNLVIARDIREINYELAVIRESLFETILTELPYKVDYATEYLIPSTLSDTDGTHRVVYSETQLDFFEGNGFVYNQLVQNGNFVDNSNWGRYSIASYNVSNNIYSFIVSSGGGNIYQARDLQANHSYLICVDVKTTTATNLVRLRVAGQNRVNAQETTNWQKLSYIYTPSASGSTTYAVIDSRSSNWDTVQVKNFMTFDLTQMGIDSVTTTEQAISELAKLGINVYVYNEYSTGEIKNTTVSGLTSKDSEDNTLATISFTPTELLGALSIHDTLSVVEGNVIEGEQRYDLVKTSNAGSVDLGTLDWDYNSELGVFASIANATTQLSKVDVKNAICQKYIFNGNANGSNQTNIANNLSDKEMCSYSNSANVGRFVVKDSSYTNATTFKTAMSGVILNFEKATPTQTTIATDLTFEQVTLLIQEGGTIGVNFTNVPPNVQTKFVVKKAVGE